MASTLQAQNILADIIEYLTEEIIFADTLYDRLEKWETLQDFWKQLPNKQNYGRLFARYSMAKMVTAVAHREPYDQNDLPSHDEKKKKTILSPPLPLVCWSSKHWTDLSSLLESTREIMLRNDVDSMLLGEENNGDQENEERAESDLYNQKVDRLLTYIRINQALADFRAPLEQQLAVKDGNVKVEPSILAKFGDIVKNDFSDDADDKARQALESLLVRGKPGKSSSTRSHGVSLVSPDELGAILHKKPFCLEMLSHRLQVLLQRWAQDVFVEKPALTKLGYSPGMIVFSGAQVEEQVDSDDEVEEEVADVKQQPARRESTEAAAMPIIDEESGEDNDENESPKKARRPKRKRDASTSPPAVENLKLARQELRDEGKDPLQEARSLASKATRTSPRRQNKLLEKKKTASRVQFDDSDDDSDDDDDDGKRAHLSDVPTRAKLPSQKKKSPKKAKTSGGKPKRKRWTDEEKRAIKEGIKKCGWGKWSEIKSEYALILKDRDSVKIKDCVRTMVNQGELTPP